MEKISNKEYLEGLLKYVRTEKLNELFNEFFYLTRYKALCNTEKEIEKLLKEIDTK